MFADASWNKIIDRAGFEARDIHDFTKASVAAAVLIAENDSLPNLQASNTNTNDGDVLSMIEPTPIGSTFHVVDSIDIRDASSLDSGVRFLCKKLIPVGTVLSHTDIERGRIGSSTRNNNHYFHDQPYDDYITMSLKRQKVCRFPPADTSKYYPSVDRIVTRDRTLQNWGVTPTVFQASPLELTRPLVNVAHHFKAASPATSTTVASRTVDEHPAKEKKTKNKNSDNTRDYHSANWTVQYGAMVQFHAEKGHCFVPSDYPENPRLSMWVKRQRYQYRLKQDGRHHNLTQDRQAKLDALGFIWDSHKIIWEERYLELVRYRKVFGRTDVPFKYHNKKLAIWVKCQRRQHRLYRQGKQSFMTSERIAKLNQIDFQWRVATARRHNRL